MKVKDVFINAKIYLSVADFDVDRCIRWLQKNISVSICREDIPVRYKEGVLVIRHQAFEKYFEGNYNWDTTGVGYDFEELLIAEVIQRESFTKFMIDF